MTYTGPKATFDGVAAVYDAVRPAYPDALIQAVVDLSGLPAEGRILEIGSGTGQATLPFAARGYALLGLEPGPNLAALAAQKLRAYPRVAIQTTTFENWPLEAGAFDLVMSATAFHWIPPEVGYPKAAQALRPTGCIALFWNLQPEAGGVFEAIQQVYADCAPELFHPPGENPLSAQVDALEAQFCAHNAPFRSLAVERFSWSERYETARYIALLNTYSNHLAFPEERRKRLHEGIARVIEQHGGYLLKPYLSVLLVAQRA